MKSRDQKSQSSQDLSQFGAAESLFRNDPADLIEKTGGVSRSSPRDRQSRNS